MPKPRIDDDLVRRFDTRSPFETPDQDSSLLNRDHPGDGYESKTMQLGEVAPVKGPGEVPNTVLCFYHDDPG